MLTDSRFWQILNEAVAQYNRKLINKMLTALSNLSGDINNELTYRNIITSMFKFIVLVICFDTIIVTAFNSLYQTTIYTGILYIGVPALFSIVIGVTSLINMFVPKKKFLIDAEEDAKLIPKVFTTCMLMNVIAINMLLIQVLYTLNAVIDEPCLHNLIYSITNNLLPCIITLSLVFLSKYSVCILDAIRKYKVATYLI